MNLWYSVSLTYMWFLVSKTCFFPVIFPFLKSETMFLFILNVEDISQPSKMWNILISCVLVQWLSPLKFKSYHLYWSCQLSIGYYVCRKGWELLSNTNALSEYFLRTFWNFVEILSNYSTFSYFCEWIGEFTNPMLFLG